MNFQVNLGVMKHRGPFMILFWFTAVTFPYAQEIEDAEETGPHRLTMMISHTHASQGVDSNGERQWLVLPSWALDYDYWLNKKWAIGLHTDIIVESFLIEHGNEMIERNYPVAPAAMILYKPGKHLTYLAGAGGEFTTGENFFLTRLGLEYGWELKKGWEVGGNLTFDTKWEAYDSWTFGVAVSKRL